MLTNQAIERLKNVIKEYKDEERDYNVKNNIKGDNHNKTNKNEITVRDEKNITLLNITNITDSSMKFKQVEKKE